MSQRRLQHQLDFADALDSKLGTMFAAASALIGLLAAVYALQAQPRGFWETAAFDRGDVTIIIVAIALYLLAVIVSTIAMWAREWDIGPNVEEAFESNQDLPEDLFIATQTSGYMAGYQRNAIINRRKVWAFRLAQFAVVVETCCLVAAVWRIVA